MKRQRQQQPGIMFGAMGLPGQRETVRADERSDYALVIKQWGALVVFVTVVFALLVADALIIGPWLGFSTGIVCSFVFSAWLIAIMKNTPVWFVGIIVGLAIIVIWLLFGLEITDSLWWELRCDWEPRNKALVSAFFLLIMCVTALPVFRFSYEIVDPRWPPTVGIREPQWGIMWPWADIPQDDGEPEVIYEEVIREVPRPVPTDGRASVIPELPPDPARVQRNGNKTVMSPSGREAKVADLVTFIRSAKTTGTSYNNVWKKRGWEYDQWCDVIDIWSQYGVVTKREERKTTKLLVDDFTEAMGRLSSAFD